MKLDRSLQECTLALLRRIATNHGVVVEDATLRGELADLLLHRLQSPAHLSGFLSHLSSEERSLLQAVRDQGWMAKSFVLERRFPQPRPTVPGGAEPGPTLSLLQKGLLFRSFAAIGSWRGEVYFVPEELRPAVDASLPPHEEATLPDLGPEREPEIVVERDPAFDVFCLLSFLSREPRRQVRGVLPRLELAKLEQEAGPGSVDVAADRWEERWRFLLHLCASGGWVMRRGAALVPSRRAARLLSGGPEEVRARLLERYLKDRGWSDLAAAGKVRQPLGGRQIDEVAGRQLLVHHLVEVADEGWVDEDRFCEALWRLNPDFLREDYASLSWAVLDLETGVELRGPDSWGRVEREWLRYVLRGPLYWLGVVRWGLSTGGRAVGFQLRALPLSTTDRGLGSLDGSSGPSRQPSIPWSRGVSPGMAARPTPGARLSLGPGGEVESPEGMDLGLLLRLEPYLQLIRRGRASSYRLTRESALAGIEAGGSWDELRELLEWATGASLPDGIRQEIDVWEADHGRFTLGAGTILSAATAEDADAVFALPGVAVCLESRLGPRDYRVIPERVWQLVEALRKAGQRPRLDPSVRREGARRALGDPAVLRESLFALKLLRSLPEGADLGMGAEAVRWLENALGPEEAEEVSRKVRAAHKRMQSTE